MHSYAGDRWGWNPNHRGWKPLPMLTAEFYSERMGDPQAAPNVASKSCPAAGGAQPDRSRSGWG